MLDMSIGGVLSIGRCVAGVHEAGEMCWVSTESWKCVLLEYWLLEMCVAGVLRFGGMCY
jgi:hypothetical protein